MLGVIASEWWHVFREYHMSVDPANLIRRKRQLWAATRCAKHSSNRRVESCVPPPEPSQTCWAEAPSVCFAGSAAKAGQGREVQRRPIGRRVQFCGLPWGGAKRSTK